MKKSLFLNSKVFIECKRELNNICPTIPTIYLANFTLKVGSYLSLSNISKDLK